MGYVSLIDGHIDNADRCVCCGRVIPEGSQYCVICGNTEPKDMVEVVRCKDCKYCRGVKDLILPTIDRFCCYRPNNFAVKDNDYCSCGVRKRG
jgi:hypothetical protein